MSIKFEKHFRIEKTQIILDALNESCDLSKQQLKKLMQNGAVWLENSHGINRVRRAKKKLNINDQLHVYYDESIQCAIPEPAILVSDMADYSIWNKPSGMYSQGTKWGDHCSIYRWAEQNLLPQGPAFIVHRLDKAANGLIIIAHKKSTAAIFSQMFEQRNIHKIYRAVVEGEIENISVPNTIENELDNKIAISEIISINIDNKNKQTEVEIKIKTGRKHQIRRHLSKLGYPIVGDRLYGALESKLNLQLSSVELEFICPVTDNLVKYVLQ